MPPDDPPEKHRLGDVRPDWLTTGARRKRDSDATPEIKVEQAWEDAEEPPSRLSRIWSVSWVGAVITTSVVAIIAIALHLANQRPAIAPQALPPIATTAERTAAATQTIRAFFAAESPAERLHFILAADRLRQPLEKFYRRANAPQPTDVSVASLRFVLIDAQPWCFAKIDLPGGQTQLAALKQTDDGYKLDWESLVAYGELPWDTFYSTRPEQPTQMRVHLAHTSYHNYKYSDPSRYAAYRITPKNGGSWLYGYVVRGSAADAALAQIVQKGMIQPANIRLHFEPDAGADNLAIIDELIHARWTSPSLIGSPTIINTLPPAPTEQADD